MRFFSRIIAIFLLAGTAFAIQFPKYTGYVNDFANVIDQTSKQKIGVLCKSLEDKTSAQMTVVTVDSVYPLDSKTYAVKLFESWGIGKEKKDNGILVLLAMKERRVEIEVGYGLEGIITDQFSGSVLNEYFLPLFKENNFGTGLYNGAYALANRIAKQYDVQMPEKSGTNGLYVFVVLIILFSIVAAFARSGKIIALIFSMLVCAAVGYVIASIFGAIIGAIIGVIISSGKITGGGGGIGPIFTGGFGNFGGGFGGGFGGFGGGRSGGGGAGRSW